MYLMRDNEEIPESKMFIVCDVGTIVPAPLCIYPIYLLTPS